MSKMNPRFVALATGVGLIVGGLAGPAAGCVAAGVICIISAVVSQ